MRIFNGGVISTFALPTFIFIAFPIILGIVKLEKTQRHGVRENKKTRYRIQDAGYKILPYDILNLVSCIMYRASVSLRVSVSPCLFLILFFTMPYRTQMTQI